MAALKDVLWDEDKGVWFDYDLENEKKNLEFYPSNFAPLWAGCFSDPDDVDKALKYLEVRHTWSRVGCYTGAGLPACSLTLTCDLWQVAATHPNSTQCLSMQVPLRPQGGGCEPRREGPGGVTWL